MSIFKKKWIIVGIGIVGILVIGWSLFHHHFSLAMVQERSLDFKYFVQRHYWPSVLIFNGIFIGTLLVGLPVFAPLALLAGFLFSFYPAVFYIFFSTMVSSLVQFIMVRWFSSEFIKRKGGTLLVAFQERVTKYGTLYLVALHYMTLIPLFVINILAALSTITIGKFIIITLLGSAPLTILYAFTGEELATLTSFRDILKPSIIIVLILLMAFTLLPLIVSALKNKRKVE